MKRAIVTGAAGFLGSHLTELLTADGVEVLAAVRLGSSHIGRIAGLPGVTILPCELDALDCLPERAKGFLPDVFFHLAWEGASGAGRAALSNQLTGVDAACRAVVAAKKLGCRKIIAAGTVYEQLTDAAAQSETFQPSSLYFISKRYAGELFHQLALREGIEGVWCSFYQPIGRYIKREQLTAQVIACLQRGESPAFGPAQQYCDLCAAEDIARGLYLAAEKPLADWRYFLGSGSPRRLKEYLTEIQLILAPDVPLLIGALPDDGLRFEKKWFDIAPFSRQTGYIPQIPFKEAVLRTALYLCEN